MAIMESFINFAIHVKKVLKINKPGNGYGNVLLYFRQLCNVSHRTTNLYFANNKMQYFTYNAEEQFLWKKRSVKELSWMEGLVPKKNNARVRINRISSL